MAVREIDRSLVTPGKSIPARLAHHAAAAVGTNDEATGELRTVGEVDLDRVEALAEVDDLVAAAQVDSELGGSDGETGLELGLRHSEHVVRVLREHCEIQRERAEGEGRLGAGGVLSPLSRA